MPDLLLSLLAGALVGAAIFILAGLFGERRAAGCAGVETLAGLRWRDFAHVVLEALRREGFVEVDLERQPGDSGFDFVLARDGEQYLLACKQARASRIDRQTVVDFAATMHMHGARGGVLATLGAVDGFTREVADANRIEIIDGARLWERVAPVLGQPAAPRSAPSQAWPVPALRFVLSAAAGLAAAGIVFAFTIAEPPSNGSAARAASYVAQPPHRAVAAPAPPTPAPVADELNDGELTARRQTVVRQIVALPTISTAIWSSRSTLVLAPHEREKDIDGVEASEEACRILLQYEELRFTRLQIEPSPGSDDPVRWRQCR